MMRGDEKTRSWERYVIKDNEKETWSTRGRVMSEGG
jgi:hypothetical protein